MSKNPNKAFRFLDYVAQVSKSWEDSFIKELLRDKTLNRAKTS